MFDEEVAVEEDGLGACEDGVGSVEVIPAGLDHADGGIGEVLDGIGEEIGGRDEVGIEDGDEFAFGGRGGGFEGARFVASAVVAVDVVDVVARVGELLAEGGGDLGGLVGGIVDDLDVEEVGGVVDLGGGLDDTLGDERFVVHGELDGDAWECGEGGEGCGDVVAVSEVGEEEVESVEAEEADGGEGKSVEEGDGGFEGQEDCVEGFHAVCSLLGVWGRGVVKR